MADPEGITDPALWQRIEAHEIGTGDASLTFIDRLARENRWAHDYAARVVLEYKRFCYLACTAGHEVTPSDQVDQVWHLHLTYSRDYWDSFCPHVLRKSLHHGPTKGAEESDRFHEQYAQTLKSYTQAFGANPPVDIWSPAALRFGKQPRAFRAMPDDIILLKDRAGYVRLIFLVLAALLVGVFAGKML